MILFESFNYEFLLAILVLNPLAQFDQMLT